MRLSQKTSRGCNGPEVRIRGNKPMGKIWLKTKQKQNEKIYTTKKKRVNRESNLAHLRGRSPPRPSRHAAKDIFN